MSSGIYMYLFHFNEQPNAITLKKSPVCNFYRKKTFLEANKRVKIPSEIGKVYLGPRLELEKWGNSNQVLTVVSFYISF